MSIRRPTVGVLRRVLTAAALGLGLTPGNAFAASILFIGNSFTFAKFSPLREYRPDSVTDLNGSGIGGVPALFKSFTAQAGLNFEVSLETSPGVGIDWHIDHKLGVIGRRPWDLVVIQGFVALDPRVPADTDAAAAAVHELAGFLRARNPAVELYLTATWSRADLTYRIDSPWYGGPIEAMARDLRAGYESAARGTRGIKSVVPVGEAWTRAIHAGVARANPYEPAGADKINLWAADNFHASTYGYYLEALVLFGSITGRDPRSLGENECSAFELGLPPARVAALEQIASEQLRDEGTVREAPRPSANGAAPARCLH